LKSKWLLIGCLLLLLAATPAFSQIKVGVFDSQRLSEETEQGKKFQAELDAFRNKVASEIEAKEKEIKNLEDQLKAQELSLSEEKRAALQKEIQKKYLDIQRMRDDASRDFQSELLEVQKKFQDELLQIVAEIGREQGYTIIFEKIQVIYFSGVVDITNDIITKFNEAYVSQQGEEGE
jgi:outer membrane protein